MVTLQQIQTRYCIGSKLMYHIIHECMCIYVYIYVYIYTLTCSYTHMYMCACVHVCVYYIFSIKFVVYIILLYTISIFYGGQL